MSKTEAKFWGAALLAPWRARGRVFLELLEQRRLLGLLYRGGFELASRSGLLRSLDQGSSRLATDKISNLSFEKFFFPEAASSYAPFVAARGFLPGIIEAADDLCLPRRRIFELVVDGPTDWHRDPLSGRRFPRHHWSKLKLPADTDIKYTWELGRCYQLTTLARAALATDAERYKEAFRAEWLSLLEANPVGQGIHFTSGLESAVRIANMLFSLRIGAGILDAPSERRALRYIAETARFVWRHIDFARYWVPNDHLLGELVAVYLAFRALQIHPRIADRAWTEIQTELLKQFSDDGVYGNQSVTYQRFALQWLLLAWRLAEVCGDELAEAAQQRLAAGARFMEAMAGAGGHAFRYGDDDGGQVLTIDQAAFQDLRPLLAALGRGGLIEQRAPLGEWAFWLFGAEPAAASPSPRAPAPTSVQRFSCGAVVSTPDERLFFRCGNNRGGNGSMIFGHADQLHVGLQVGNTPVLVDGGTYRYNAAPAWRAYFTSTGAHNTVEVAQEDQMERLTTFLWSRRTCAQLHAGSLQGRYGLLSGQHDGYRSRGVAHHRTVLLIGGAGLMLIDQLSAREPKAFEVCLHFAADHELQRDGAGRHLVSSPLGQLDLLHRATVPLGIRTRRGQEAPLEGWRSASYGERHPAPVCVASGTAEGWTAVVTLLRWDQRLLLDDFCFHGNSLEADLRLAGERARLAIRDGESPTLSVEENE